MKTGLFFSLVIVIGCGCVQIAFSQDLLESIERLNAFDVPEARVDTSAYLAATNQVIRSWNSSTDDDRARFATKMFLVHFRRAELLAASGNFAAAASELSEEASLQKTFEGRIEFSTKSPDAFFRDLVELQAQVTAETGSDPLAGKVDYLFHKDSNGFAAARLELSNDVAGITVPEKNSEEALALVHHVSRQGDRFVASAPKWFVVPQGRLSDVLKQAKREVVFDQAGKMTVHNLQTESSTASIPTNFESVSAESQLPPEVESTAPKKSLKAKTMTAKPSEEPKSLSLWSLVAGLIVAAIGLLWFLLKNRK